MQDTKHIATITILIKDRATQAGQVNTLLTDLSHLTMARLGVNVDNIGEHNYNGLITLVINGTENEIQDFADKLNALDGVTAKHSIIE